MKTELKSNLSRVFLMQLSAKLDGNQVVSGKLHFGILNPANFLIPVEVQIPKELHLAFQELATKTEDWLVETGLLFEQATTTTTEATVETFTGGAPRNLLVEEDE
jgi:hypothetical protein